MTLKSRINRLHKIIAPVGPCRCNGQATCDADLLPDDERREAIRLTDKIKAGRATADTCPDCGGERPGWDMAHLTDDELDRLLELADAATVQGHR